MEFALGLGVGGEPVLAVDLLVVGGEGRLEVFVALAGVLGDGLAVDEDDLEVLLVDPDLALEVVLVFSKVLGRRRRRRFRVHRPSGGRGSDVVFGQVFGGEDEGEAVLDLVEVGGSHRGRVRACLPGRRRRAPRACRRC